MRMYDIIDKKKRGEVLTDAEIKFFIDGFTDGSIPDYQAAALLVAICLRGMTEKETFALTDAMLHSGDVVDLSNIAGIKVDKHSTGGVADTTTIAVAPICAALGLKVAKMSGRGLGFTGGTIDKLESITGFRTELNAEEFASVVSDVGCSVIGQSGVVAPADKKLYALRDVTATIDCVPLIASSIMSKKLASGSDVILLDVKFGNGAFMKTAEAAIELSRLMVKIGENAGKRVAALVTSMEQPLGKRIGNSLEILNIIDVLHGVPSRLYTEILLIAAKLQMLAGKETDEDAARRNAVEAIESGRALDKLKQMVSRHGGDEELIDHPERFEIAEGFDVLSEGEGYVSEMQTASLGEASMLLGGGREKKSDVIDNSVGIEMEVELGDYVKKGDVLARLYHKQKGFNEAVNMVKSAIILSDAKPKEHKIVYAYVDKAGVTEY